MKIVCCAKPAWRAVGPRFILLGLITLLLLPAPAPGQSGWPPGVPQTSPPGTPEVCRVNLAPPDLRLPAPGRKNPLVDLGKPAAREAIPQDLGKTSDNVRISGRHLARPPVASPPASGWLPWQCPLPPASAFSLQTNLRRYLETWPTPGSTATEAWPEYVPEDGAGLD
jgi:hypothetical protein